MKLNLGCGEKHKPGFINADRIEPADILLDLGKKLPFRDQAFSRIEADNVLEHLDNNQFLTAMNEIHRLLRADGVFWLRVPNAVGWPEGAMGDPTHKRFFVPRSFHYLDIARKEWHLEGRRYGFKPWKLFGLRDDGQFCESEMAPAYPGSVEEEKADDRLLAAAEIERLPAAAGSIEHASFSEWMLRVEGWMMLPDGDLDTTEVWWNGRNRGAARWMHRSDVAEAYPRLEHSGNSGFQFSWDASRAESAAGRIDVIGYRRDQAVARLSTFYRAGLDRTIPAPAPKAGGESAEVFRSRGLKMFTDLFDAVHRSGGWNGIGRLLDWGCGFGRVTAHLLQDPALQGSRPEVCGCDRDDEALAWCRRHLPTATFESMGAHPPTRYPDRCFDLVIGCSTLNELKKTAWPGWLAELRRIVAPGGLVVLSIHGGLAAFQPASGWGRWLRGEPAADQRARHAREFFKDFEVVECLERGLNGHEDLVVLRRPKG